MQIQQTIINLTESNPDITQSLMILGLTALIYFVKKFVFEKLIKKVVEKTPAQFDNDLYPFVNRMLSIVIWVVGFCYILTNLGVNVNGLLTILGANAIIIAYACKDTMSNIAAGLVIMGDRPFREGDEINLPSGEYVTVLKIGLRRSRFLYDPEENDIIRNIIIVPNSDLAKSKIKNYTYGRELNE